MKALSKEMIRASVSALESGQLQQSVVFSQAPSPDTSMVMHMSAIDQGLNESINLGGESIDGVRESIFICTAEQI